VNRNSKFLADALGVLTAKSQTKGSIFIHPSHSAVTAPRHSAASYRELVDSHKQPRGFQNHAMACTAVYFAAGVR
jgi:hypothetical protein